MQIGIVLVAVHMRCNHNKWGMLLTRSVEEILRHVMSNVQATFHDSRKRYAMKNRCLSFKMCSFPCRPVLFFVLRRRWSVIHTMCVVGRIFFFLSSSRPIAFRFVSCRCFVRPLVQLGFVSFRVDASRFVSFRVAASFVLSFSCVSFRSVSTRRGEKERNKQRKKTNKPQLLSACGWSYE